MEAQKASGIEATFAHYDADEITTDMLSTSGWVPAQNVEPLLREIGEAPGCFYYTDDGMEAFVAIDN